MGKKTILFVCVHNSGRSQMAEAFFNSLANKEAVAISAGTQPALNINPLIVRVMNEVGIDISRQKPRMLTMEMMQSAHRAISMGCGVAEACPARMVPTEDWQLDDPEGQPLEKVRKIRDAIRNKVVSLIKELSIENKNVKWKK